MGYSFHKGRAIVEETDDGLRITIPTKRSFGQVLVSLFFFLFWILTEISLIALIYHVAFGTPKGNPPPLAACLLFLTLWSLMGLWIVVYFSWALLGKEIVTMSAQEMTVGKAILAFEKKKSYDLGKIKHLRPSPLVYDVQSKSAGPFPSGNIAFDHGAETVRWGEDIGEEEARALSNFLLHEFFVSLSSDDEPSSKDSAKGKPFFGQQFGAIAKQEYFKFFPTEGSLAVAHVGGVLWVANLADQDRPENHANGELLEKYENIEIGSAEFYEADEKNFELNKDNVNRVLLDYGFSLFAGTMSSSGTLTFSLSDGMTKKFLLVGRQDTDEIIQALKNCGLSIETKGTRPAVDWEESDEELKVTFPPPRNPDGAFVGIALLLISFMFFSGLLHFVFKAEGTWPVLFVFVPVVLMPLVMGLAFLFSQFGKEVIVLGKEDLTISRCFFDLGPKLRYHLDEMRNLRLLDDPLQAPAVTPLQGLSSLMINGRGSLLAFDCGQNTVYFGVAPRRSEAESVLALMQKRAKITSEDMSKHRDEAKKQAFRRSLAIFLAIISMIFCTALYTLRNAQRRKAQRVTAALPRDKRSEKLDLTLLESGPFRTGITLTGCRGFDDEDLAQIKNPRLDGVAFLYLGNTAITDKGLVHLKGKRLSMLDLSGTAVTNEGLKELEGLPLRRLILRNTKVTKEAIEAFKADKPRLRILY